MEIYSIVHKRGIFIWWPKLHITNLSHLNIQFRYNNTSNPTIFSDQIIVTVVKLNELEQWDDIYPNLINVSAKTNVYPEFQGSRKKRLIFNNLQQFASSAESMPPYMNDGLKTSDAASKTSEKSEGITEVQVKGIVTGISIPNAQFIEVRVLVPIMDIDGEFYQDNTYVEWKTVSR